MIDKPLSYSNQPGGSNKKKTAIIIAVVVVILALVGGFLMFRQTQEKDQTEVPVVEKKTLTPTPTEKPKIDKKSVKIQVLNGTGTPGQANTTVEALKKAGYNSDNIKTGNAEEFDNAVTTINARADYADVANDIKDALETIFAEVKIESSQLDVNSEFDIVVVTGGKKFEETTATPTSIPTLSSSSPTPNPTTATTTITPSSTSSPTPTP